MLKSKGYSTKKPDLEKIHAAVRRTSKLLFKLDNSIRQLFSSSYVMRKRSLLWWRFDLTIQRAKEGSSFPHLNFKAN